MHFDLTPPCFFFTALVCFSARAAATVTVPGTPKLPPAPSAPDQSPGPLSLQALSSFLPSQQRIKSQPVGLGQAGAEAAVELSSRAKSALAGSTGWRRSTGGSTGGTGGTGSMGGVASPVVESPASWKSSPDGGAGGADASGSTDSVLSTGGTGGTGGSAAPWLGMWNSPDAGSTRVAVKAAVTLPGAGFGGAGGTGGAADQHGPEGLEVAGKGIGLDLDGGRASAPGAHGAHAPMLGTASPKLHRTFHMGSNPAWESEDASNTPLNHSSSSPNMGTTSAQLRGSNRGGEGTDAGAGEADNVAQTGQACDAKGGGTDTAEAAEETPGISFVDFVMTLRKAKLGMQNNYSLQRMSATFLMEAARDAWRSESRLMCADEWVRQEAGVRWCVERVGGHGCMPTALVSRGHRGGAAPYGCRSRMHCSWARGVLALRLVLCCSITPPPSAFRTLPCLYVPLPLAASTVFDKNNDSVLTEEDVRATLVDVYK